MPAASRQATVPLGKVRGAAGKIRDAVRKLSGASRKVRDAAGKARGALWRVFVAASEDFARSREFVGERGETPS
jgi:hypothetical protein